MNIKILNFNGSQYKRVIRDTGVRYYKDGKRIAQDIYLSEITPIFQKLLNNTK